MRPWCACGSACSSPCRRRTFQDLDLAFKGRVEAVRASGVAKAMQDEPSRLLGDAQVRRQRGRSDALGVVRNHPDRGEPLGQRQLRVLKDRADLDRELTPAGVAFVLVRQDASAAHTLGLALFGTAAQGAKHAVAEADRRQVVDSRLLGREGREQLGQGFEGLDHGWPRLMKPPYPISGVGQARI